MDVPVPQIPVRPSRRELHEVLSRLSRSLEEEEVVAEDVDEEEEEEEEKGSRFLPHFRPRRWCRFVLAGATCPRGWQCTFAHHESELHPDSWWAGVAWWSMSLLCRSSTWVSSSWTRLLTCPLSCMSFSSC